MLTVITLLKLKPSPNGEQHGERAFWREFGERYLDLWLQTVDRFVPKPHRVIVMTDTHSVIPQGVTTRQLDITTNAPGFWAKLEMFRHGRGKTLYCDLDNIIAGPIDELCALEPDPLIMLDDRRVPGLPNGSTILFDADRCRNVWRSYCDAPRHWEAKYVVRGVDYSRAFDQAFLADCFRHDFPLFQQMLPAGYCLNAYSELPFTHDWGDARLVFGCGPAKPHASMHPIYRTHWVAA